MPACPLPPFLAVATIKTPTKTAQDRFFEIFPPLVAHSKDNEPETLSYYFFTSAAADDHAIYGFEGYPNVAALVDVHAKSDTYKRQSAILAEEKLCTVDVDHFRPVSGFLLREGETEQPAGLILISKVQPGDATRAGLEGLARHAEAKEVGGTASFVVMEHLKTGELWTFERYATRYFYEETHAKSEAFSAIFGGGPAASEYVEANVGFLLK